MFYICGMEKNNKLGYIPRLLFKFYLRLKDRFDPPKEVSPEEQFVVEICKKLIYDIDSKLTIAPLSNKRYIKNDTKSMFIVIEGGTIMLINHIYSYTVHCDFDDHYKDLIKSFDDVVEKKRNELENEIKSNIRHSLKKILEGL